MTLELSFSPAEEALLRKKAKERGVSVETMIKNAALGTVDKSTTLSGDDLFQNHFADLQHLLPEPHVQIPDEALRRENLYADED